MFAKTAAMMCDPSLLVCPFGSSLSSDIAAQVTGIVFDKCASKFSSFGCCHLFPPLRRFCFSFLLDHTISGVHRAWLKQCPKWRQRWTMRSQMWQAQDEVEALTEGIKCPMVEIRLEDFQAMVKSNQKKTLQIQIKLTRPCRPKHTAWERSFWTQ